MSKSKTLNHINLRIQIRDVDSPAMHQEFIVPVVIPPDADASYEHFETYDTAMYARQVIEEAFDGCIQFLPSRVSLLERMKEAETEAAEIEAEKGTNS